MGEFEMEAMRYELEILTKEKNMHEVMEFVQLCVSKIGCSAISHQLEVVGEELAYNIFSYAYDEQPGSFTLEIYLEPVQNKIIMKFRDKGKPYNPLEHETRSDISIGGLGIKLSKKLTDTQMYKYEDGYNILVVEKYVNH